VTATAAAFVDQLMLPGQAAAPEGPVDIAPMYLMHHAFRRDLDAFADVVPTVAVSDRARWGRIARRFGFFSTVLHKHHSGEDRAMWPLLAEKGADQAVLDALESEHAGIDPLLTSVADDLRSLADGTGDATTRDRLADTTVRLRDGLKAHLAHEERDGMALVQKHSTQADWDRLDREVFKKDYTPREVPAVAGWVANGLSDDALRRMPDVSAALFAVATFMGRRAARRDARILGVRR
jgi:hypothetical protein